MSAETPNETPSSMTPDEAAKRFREADQRYREQDFAGALAILEDLDARFPNDRNLLYARARTLGKIGREDEALALCDRLVSEFGYSRAARLQVKLLKSLTEQIDQDAEAGTPPPIDIPSEPEDESEAPKEPRFRIKPVRLLLLIGLVVLTLMKLIHPLVSIGIVVAYFVLKWAIGRLILRLFSAPFKMKAKALAGATVEIHDVSIVTNPDPGLIEEVGEEHGGELRFVQIDVTIQPQSKSEGFTHWEPGELSIAPDSMTIKGLDDLDHCFSVAHVKIVHEGVERDDDGYKLNGPARVKLLVGLPPGAQGYQFVYYTQAFGNVQVPA